MTRRRALEILTAVVLGMAALVFFWRPRWLWRLIPSLLAPRLDASSPTGVLAEGQMQTVLAFAEVLVEVRGLSPVERRHLAEHIDTRTRNTPGYFSLYRTTARLLERLGGGQFSVLDPGRRAEMMVRHRLVPSEVRLREYLMPFRRQALAVRGLAAPDLIEAYYRSPAGWAVVRYAAFPGRCGSLLRYTLSEG
jgi:hypothetical protein